MNKGTHSYKKLVKLQHSLEISTRYRRLLAQRATAEAAAGTKEYENSLRRVLAQRDIRLVEPAVVEEIVYNAQVKKLPQGTVPDRESMLAEIRAAMPEPAPEAERAAAEADLQQQLVTRRAELEAAATRKYAAQIAAEEKRITRLTEACKKQQEALGGEAKADLPPDITLHVKDLCMYFGGVHAVEKLSFDVKKGEIFGLIGPNGAGKTTVFNCITQFYKPTAGTLLFRNGSGSVIDLTGERVHDVINQGIIRTFQNVEVIREVTVLENLLIAGHRQFTVSLTAQALHLPSLQKQEAVIRAKALEVLAFMGLEAYRDWYAMGLPYGILKKVEIARTLMCDPELVILDEPAAGLNDKETEELTTLIRRIRDTYGCTVLLVEHDMGLVMSVCETVCAISFGSLLAIGTPEEIQANRNVQKAYLGENDEAANAEEGN